MSVKISNLTKVFKQQKAVNNISFEASEGEIVGFLGPNGAGKSTTMKIITGYIPPSEGGVEVCGFDVTQKPLDAQKNIGYLPEHNPLYLDLYVKEYLSFIGSLHKISGKKLKSRVADMVALTGLEVEQNKKIGALSKGYRQRVGLAQALIHDPKVLILDEPTTGLDPNQIVEIRNVIKSISKDKTVILSTHIMQEVQAICDRVVIINKGEIVANDSVESLKHMNENEMRIVVEYKEEVNEKAFEALEGIKSITKTGDGQYLILANLSEDIRNEVFRLSYEKGWSLVGLKVEELTLENVFQQLTVN